MADTADRARGRRAAALAAACAVGLVVAYVLLVRTGTGQRLDGTALEHRFAVTEGAVDRSEGLLEAIDARSVLGLSAALVLVALLRRRVALAVGTVAALAGAALSARALKDHVLTRTDLGGFGGVSYNTFPSGHATVGMALALALVLVAPRRLVGPAVGVAALVAPTIGVATVATGGHRPSDSVGAFLATTAWFAACAAAVVGLERIAARPRREPTPGEHTDGPAVAILAGAGAASAVLIVLLARSVLGPGRREGLGAGPYVAGALGIDVLGVALVVVFAAARHGWAPVRIGGAREAARRRGVPARARSR